MWNCVCGQIKKSKIKTLKQILLRYHITKFKSLDKMFKPLIAASFFLYCNVVILFISWHILQQLTRSGPWFQVGHTGRSLRQGIFGFKVNLWCGFMVLGWLTSRIVCKKIQCLCRMPWNHRVLCIEIWTK